MVAQQLLGARDPGPSSVLEITERIVEFSTTFVDLLGQLSNPSDQVKQGIPTLERPDLMAIGSSSNRPGRHVRRLSPTEVDTLIGRYRDGGTVNGLAGEFGIHRGTVMDHLRRHGIPRRSDAMRWTPEQLAQVTDLYREGLSAAAIGSQYGLDPSTVSKRLKRAGVKLRPRPGRT